MRTLDILYGRTGCTEVLLVTKGLVGFIVRWLNLMSYLVTVNGNFADIL